MKKPFLLSFVIILFISCKKDTISELNPLDTIFENASQNENLRCLIVYKDGNIVKDDYFIGTSQTPHDVRSVTKSITATLTGIAIDNGFLASENENINSYLTPYVNPINATWSNVKVRDVISMTTGITVDELANPSEYVNWFYNAPNQLDYTLNIPIENNPGEVFTYNSGITHLMSAVITQSTNLTTEQFAKDYLFNPLNINNYSWETDKQGVYNGGAGLQISPRDMLKVGQLYLNNGEFNNTRIVSEEWISKASSFKVSTNSAQSFGPNYGYSWWIGNAHNHDYFFANGYGGQFIVIVPDSNLIVIATNNWSGVPTTTANEQWYNTIDMIINEIIPLY